jgi:hypothetical protein
VQLGLQSKLNLNAGPVLRLIAPTALMLPAVIPRN